MTSLTVAPDAPRSDFSSSSSVSAKPTRRSRPISWLRKVRGAVGPLAASFANPSAVRITRPAVERGIVSASRVALRATRSGARMRSEASRTKSSSGLGSSGSQRSSVTSTWFPSGVASRMIVPTSIAATPSTSAWWVLLM